MKSLLEHSPQSIFARANKAYSVGLATLQQAIMGCLIAVPVTIISFFIVYILMLLLAPLSSHSRSTPNLQIKQTDPTSFLAIYANPTERQKLCASIGQAGYSLGKNDLNFEIIGFTYAQFCNFNHEHFPNMNLNSPIDIRIDNLPLDRVQYVKACLHKVDAKAGQRQACQKYMAGNNILAFSEVKLNKVSYFTFDIRVRNHDDIVRPTVRFDEKLNFLQDFLISYYVFIGFGASCMVGTMFGLAACFCYIAQSFNEDVQGNQNLKRQDGYEDKIPKKKISKLEEQSSTQQLKKYTQTQSNNPQPTKENPGDKRRRSPLKVSQNKPHDQPDFRNRMRPERQDYTISQPILKQQSSQATQKKPKKQ